MAVLLLIAFVGISVAVFIERERNRAVASLARAELAESQAQTLLHRAQEAENELKARTHLARTAARRRSGQVGQRFDCLAELDAALKFDPTPELRAEIRNEALAAMALTDVQRQHSWQGWPDESVHIAFTADFRRFARLDRNGIIAICRRTDVGEETMARLTCPEPLPTHGLALSGDGQFLAVRHGGLKGLATKLTVWKLDPRHADLQPTIVLSDTGSAWLHSISFSADGRQLVFANENGRIRLHDLEMVQNCWDKAFSSKPRVVAFSPGGRQVAVVSGREVVILDAATGVEKGRLKHDATIREIFHLAWHPDDQRLATACNDRLIHLWNVATQREVMAPWTGQTNGGIKLAFNHTGDRLVSFDWHRQSRLWDTNSGRVLLTMPGDYGLQFSRDDALLGPYLGPHRRIVSLGPRR